MASTEGNPENEENMINQVFLAQDYVLTNVVLLNDVCLSLGLVFLPIGTLLITDCTQDVQMGLCNRFPSAEDRENNSAVLLAGNKKCKTRQTGNEMSERDLSSLEYSSIPVGEEKIKETCVDTSVQKKEAHASEKLISFSQNDLSPTKKLKLKDASEMPSKRPTNLASNRNIKENKNRKTNCQEHLSFMKIPHQQAKTLQRFPMALSSNSSKLKWMKKATTLDSRVKGTLNLFKRSSSCPSQSACFSIEDAESYSKDGILLNQESFSREVSTLSLNSDDDNRESDVSVEVFDIGHQGKPQCADNQRTYDVKIINGKLKKDLVPRVLEEISTNKPDGYDRRSMLTRSMETDSSNKTHTRSGTYPSLASKSSEVFVFPPTVVDRENNLNSSFIKKTYDKGVISVNKPNSKAVEKEAKPPIQFETDFSYMVLCSPPPQNGGENGINIPGTIIVRSPEKRINRTRNDPMNLLPPPIPKKAKKLLKKKEGKNAPSHPQESVTKKNKLDQSKISVKNATSSEGCFGTDYKSFTSRYLGKFFRRKTVQSLKISNTGQQCTANKDSSSPISVATDNSLSSSVISPEPTGEVFFEFGGLAIPQVRDNPTPISLDNRASNRASEENGSSLEPALADIREMTVSEIVEKFFRGMD